MKQLKKTLLALLCVGVLFGMTACGTDEPTNDPNVQDATEGKQEEKDPADDSGVLEDVGRGVDHGVRDVVDGVEEGVEDMTGGDATDRANHADTSKDADKEKDNGTVR